MSFIKAVDAFVLKHITKFSHWFQRLTGKTCYFLAKTMFLLVVASCVLDICNFWTRILYRESSIFNIIFSLLIIWFYGDFIYEMDKSDRHIQSGERTKIYNVFLRIPPAFRVIFVMIGCLEIFILSGLFFMKEGFWFFSMIYYPITTYITFGIYFASVDPLPPGTSKVREWIKSFNAGFQKLQPLESLNNHDR